MNEEKTSKKQKRVVAKPVHLTDDKKLTNREMWAMVCYYYPQYTLKEASQLSIRDIKLLLRIADKMDSQKMFNLTQIAAAPHTKKGSGVKTLSEHFKKRIE